MNDDHSKFGQTSENPVTSMADSEVRNWCIALHAGTLAGYLYSGGLLSILVPLVIWLIQKDKHPAIDEHGKESLNFQISILIWSVCCIPLVFLFGLGAVLIVALIVTDIICVIIASIKASEGILYRYPITIRLIK